ncbi:TPA: hypothetical protein ACH3X3_003818 [Trebouxia sp. C0006]
MLAEELQRQWHDKLNRHLGDILIQPYSNRKAWWSCDQCPKGLPHVWEAYVHNKTQGTGCPFCSGVAVCQHNTLATKAPQLQKKKKKKITRCIALSRVFQIDARNTREGF